MIKLGIIGSRKWNDKEKVSAVVDQCLAKYGRDLMVVSGGAKGADTHGKIVALEKGLKYREYNPAHEAWNEYSGKPKEWYEKEYKVSNFFERNTFIAEDSDIILAFIPTGHQSNGTMDTVKKAEKMNKPCLIIN
jgi:predicted Rossmann-fold nucleotide-binding protein